MTTERNDWPKLSPADSSWQTRQRRGEKCTHSFNEFVAKARTTKEGQEHLARHHRGYNPKGE